MGFIRVVLEDEAGRRLEQGIIIPSNVLPKLNEEQFSCLRFIDPYGDTVFNRPQMPSVLADLRVLRSRLKDEQIQNYVVPVEGMAKACEDGVHLYLRFVGD